VRDLAIDPDARVLVFVDGQNLYKACGKLFDHPLCHPHLLAEYLAGPRTNHRVGCRFYTGRPNPNISPRQASHLDRRIAAMSGVGVSAITRQLRYHWDWGHQQDLPQPGPHVAPETVTLAPYQRPQEKGIDLVLALDVIEFFLDDIWDVAIIVSLDRDLCEIPTAIGHLRHLVRREIRLEAAVPVAADAKPKSLSGFSFTHQIRPDVFALVRDDVDYTVPDDQWVAPTLPQNLAERRVEMAQLRMPFST